MATTIAATTPVTVPAVPSKVYDSWFVTQLVGKFSPTSGPTTVTLQRAALNEDGSWSLMPGRNSDTTVTFNVDIMKEITSGNSDATLMATAFSAVVAAVDAYATAKHII